MTCIVAYTNDRGVFMGSDSANTTKTGSLMINKDPKIFRIGDLLCAREEIYKKAMKLRIWIDYFVVIMAVVGIKPSESLLKAHKEFGIVRKPNR